MSMTKAAYRVRGLASENYSEAREDVQGVVDNRGDLIVTQGLPELTDLVRLGNSWQILSAVTAALTAVPSTTAGHSLWNGEPATGKSYAIDSFGCVEVITDSTQQNSAALFAMMSVGAITAPTDAALTKASLSGRTAGQTKARTVAGATVLATDVWTPHGPSAPGATAFAGGVWRVHECPVRGLYLVQPGGQFNVAVAKTAATASQIRYFIRWHEVQLIWTP